MFDMTLSEPPELGSVDDAALVTAITGWAQIEAAAAARRLAAIAELLTRRTGGDAFDRSRWPCDNWDLAASEVAAAEHTSHGMASGQLYPASALRDRLPKVAALFLDGKISARLAATIARHTTLITGPDLMARVDTELAELAVTLGPLPVAKTAIAIAIAIATIERHDPTAVRRVQEQARGREVVIDTRNSEAGTTGLRGRLFAVDAAAALDERLMQLALTVCDDDPARWPNAAPTPSAPSPSAPKPSPAPAPTPTAQPPAPPTGEPPPSSSTSSPTKPPCRPDPGLSGEPTAASTPPTPPAPSGRIIRGDQPATGCDIDHAIAYPHRPTNLSKADCLC